MKQLSLFDVTPEVTKHRTNGRKPTAPALPVARNYVIDSPVGEGGAVTKYNANIAAIKVLKELGEKQANPEQQAVLAQYVGWGGIPQVFNKKNKAWQARVAELEDILDDEEYVQARRSTINAHYTSIPVVRAMWQGVNHLGFQAGSVLEPAIGIGHFFGAMPASRSSLVGLDLDYLSASIAQKLYPKAYIVNTPYQKFSYRTQFDLAISNVPFARVKVNDPATFQNGTNHLKNASLHDYYFIKTINMVRPGGIIAFITSRFTMDKADSSLREYLASKTTLLGAFRLPSDAFKKNAMTETTMDIVFLQKTPEANPAWINVESFGNGVFDEKGNEGKYFVNRYFLESPGNMIGDMVVNSRKHKGTAECVYSSSEDWIPKLEELMLGMPSQSYKQPLASSSRRAVTVSFDTNRPYRQPKDKPWLREGSFDVDEWYRVWQKQEGRWVKLEHGKKAARTRDMCETRDAFRRLLYANIDNASDDDLVPLRDKLNRIYDQFVKRHDFINNRVNAQAFKSDPDYYPMLALEKWDPDYNVAKKQRIFFERLPLYHDAVSSVDNAVDALGKSLNHYGRINFDYMLELLGDKFTVNSIIEDLDDAIYEDPSKDDADEHQWITSEQYLSGNVRAKLKEAEEAAAKDSLRYQRNVDALKGNQPRKLLPAELTIRFGASFVPAHYVEQFINQRLWNRDTGVKVEYSEVLARWIVNWKDRHSWVVDRSTENLSKWGTSRVSAMKLISKTLNHQIHIVRDIVEEPGQPERTVANPKETLAAQQRQEAIKNAWDAWWVEDSQRAEEITLVYNEKLNNYKLREYDGSHLTFPEMNSLITLRKHQSDVVWRIIQDRNVLMAHIVGAGKTFAMIAAAMKMKQLGIAKKPIMLVKKSTFSHILADAYLLYPNANILAVGSMPSKKRKYMTGRIAMEDWDLIVMTHETFKALPLSPATVRQFYAKQLRDIEEMFVKAMAENGKKDPTTKELEKKKLAIATKMESLESQAGKKDDGLFFEELGVDCVIYDESQKIKNLYYPTSMSRMPGIGGSESGIAFDAFMKFRWMQDNRDGRLIFATGTPIENTIGEMYTLLRYMMFHEMEHMGIQHFDSWAGIYGDEVTAVEMTPDGGDFKLKTRFARFNNLTEMIIMFRSFADVQMDNEKLGLDVPSIIGGAPQAIKAELSPDQKAITDSLVTRAANLDPRNRTDDNMLMVVGDARKCALDTRLLGDYEDNPQGKVNKCVSSVLELYHRPLTENAKTQLIFCDLFQSNGHNVYTDIVNKLMDGGIPYHEIAIAQNMKTDEQKALMQLSAREGKTRVVLGSTQTLGIGVNVQDRLIACNMLDVPWKPAEYEQRIGRIVRQGNLNKEVMIINFLTERTFDVFMWETNQRKARFIAQVLAGDLTVRTAEDIEAAVITYSDMAAIASGNPLMLERVKVEADLTKYRSMRQQHYDQRALTRQEAENLAGMAETQEQVLVKLEPFLEEVKSEGSESLITFAKSLYPRCKEVWEDGITHMGKLYGCDIIFNNNVKVEKAKDVKDDIGKLMISPEYIAALKANVVQNIQEFIEMRDRQLAKKEEPSPEKRIYTQQIAVTYPRGTVSFRLRVGKDDHAEKNAEQLLDIFSVEKLAERIAKIKRMRRDYLARREQFLKVAEAQFAEANELQRLEDRYEEIQKVLNEKAAE